MKREKISATAVTARQSLGRSAIFSLVLVVGVEPTRCCHLRILSPVRLPFRHTSILNCRAVETKVINFVYAQDFKSVRLPLPPQNLCKLLGTPSRHTSILNCRAVETKVMNFVYAQDFKSCGLPLITPKSL